MHSFRQLFEAAKLMEATGGQAGGKMEISKISLEDARNYTRAEFKKNRRLDEGGKIEDVLPNFDENFINAQNKVKRFGKTLRRHMPVVDFTQVRDLQRRLKHGNLDVKRPWHDETNPRNPFPQGLSGDEAKKWLTRGLRDGSLKDDIINVQQRMIVVDNILPLQKQIYFDKSISEVAKFGVEASRQFFGKAWIIVTSDMYLIDGHHRWLSSVIIDPTMRVPGIEVDWPLKKFLPLIKAYGDAIGNKRNR